jgi:2-polyprenyl-3-methyl-5-hydroxy-6-metoxy-1,4-benzoquinol methylase
MMPDASKTSGQSTLERSDQELFDQIAETYCRKDLLPAHRIARQQRLTQTLRDLPATAQTTILEVGCGAGFAARYLRGRYRSYYGIDHSEKLIEYAVAANQDPRVAFRAINVKDLSGEKRFDIILMIGVLHHLDEPQGMLRKLRRNLNPGGWIVANEPQPTNPIIRAMRAARKHVDPGYSLDQREFTAGELTRMFSRAGLTEVAVAPQGYISTPFAEVIMPFQPVIRWLSSGCCAIDRMIERSRSRTLAGLSWNVIVRGRRPMEEQGGSVR